MYNYNCAVFVIHLSAVRGIAQLVEQRSPKPRVEGSSPSAPAMFNADIAQSVEHFLGKEEVTGSSPVISSKVNMSL